MHTSKEGNKLLQRQKRRQSVAMPTKSNQPLTTATDGVKNFEISLFAKESDKLRKTDKILDLLHRYSIATFAILLLIIGAVGTQLAGFYVTGQSVDALSKTSSTKLIGHVNVGLNATISSRDLQSKVDAITNQPATMSLGEKVIPISPEIIKNWLNLTSNKSKSEYYIHLDANTISKSLTDNVNTYLVTPVDQVTATHEDGSTAVIVAGIDGLGMSDAANIPIQAQLIAKTLLDAKGISLNVPTQTIPFQQLTPSAFEKLLEADVTSKKMYAYEHGQLVKSFFVSAGAPETPTPLGKFQVYSKLPVQDMWGYGVGHKYYFQPHVRWISYFTGGNAVHGVYWHPDTWFGVHNSSHGCVGVTDEDAQWVYDWAPIGTTVITHA